MGKHVVCESKDTYVVAQVYIPNTQDTKTLRQRSTVNLWIVSFTGSTVCSLGYRVRPVSS